MSAFTEAYYRLFPPPSVRTLLEADRRRTTYRGWIPGPCQNCGKMASEHPQTAMACFSNDRGAE